MVSAAFMIVHVFTLRDCFESSGFVTLVAGTIMMLPTTLSGWLTWKRRYRGARVAIFLNKARISYGMIVLGAFMIAWRSSFPAQEHTIWHYLFASGITLLFLGAVVEGYFGERLNHR